MCKLGGVGQRDSAWRQGASSGLVTAMRTTFQRETDNAGELEPHYQSIFGDVSRIVDAARGAATRSVNAVITAAYWLIGQHIVAFEQEGKSALTIVKRLSNNLPPTSLPVRTEDFRSGTSGK